MGDAASVLFVDDDPGLRRTFARELRDAPYLVDTAANAREALGCLAKRPYQVLVSDLDLPQRTGVELIVEALGKQPELGCILVTGHTDIDLRENAVMDRALVGMLRKPWERSALLGLLADAAERHHRSSVPVPAALDRVLVIEADRARCRLLDGLLAASFPTIASDCVPRLDAAIARLHAEEHALVLVDMSLPDARGLDAIRRLRDEFPALAIVAVSAVGDRALSAQALAAGAQDVIHGDALTPTSFERTLRFALDRKIVEQRLSAMATTDALTGLANRPTFERALRQAMAKPGTTPGVLFLDLDDFKGVNDRHGHAAGDQLLQHVAAMLRGALRADDLPARLHGDEFAVLVQDTDELALAHVAERVVRALRVPALIGPTRHEVRASMGRVVAWADESPGELLARADAAMYRHKRSGKPPSDPPFRASGAG
ncbi:MAG: response regulator PleD [Myxococcota bacterium]